MPKFSVLDAQDAIEAPEAGRSTGTAAFSKFMAVLQRIADAGEPLNIAQLAAQTGYPRPTVYRIVGRG
jgi:IclR family KDG regulon transcriptional repressor